MPCNDELFNKSITKYVSNNLAELNDYVQLPSDLVSYIHLCATINKPLLAYMQLEYRAGITSSTCRYVYTGTVLRNPIINLL